MTHGQYILDRWMVGVIEAICLKHGIDYRSYSDDWLLELSHKGIVRRVFGYKFSINDAAATAIAGDKVATYQLLHAHGISAVEHRLVRTKASESTDWAEGFSELVVKPLDGTSGHGVGLLASPTHVPGYIQKHQAIAAWAVSPYQQIQSERRFIILDGELICQYQKSPIEIHGLKMFNLGLGATVLHNEATDLETKLAVRAVNALGLRLAAVDIILTPEGYKVLEVNDGIMMENYMRQSEENKKQATNIYESIILALFSA
jgi:glutathione synthase/RimK-type ligase-like ATP-grasp enzyme